MGEHTGISWADATFNAWWGCVEVSEACIRCYARREAERFGHRNLWGKDADRRFFSDKHWNDLYKWDSAAKEAGERRRVFWNSMSDIMEEHPLIDEALLGARCRAWKIMEETPNLVHLLLTKRPENYARFLPAHWTGVHLPENVWPGITAETQKRFDERWPHVMKLHASVLWVSHEPAIEPIVYANYSVRPSWWIIGGESGGHARIMDPAMVRDMRNEADACGVAFWMKQWGEHGPTEIPNRLETMKWMGKKAAGDLLDGKQYRELPR